MGLVVTGSHGDNRLRKICFTLIRHFLQVRLSDSLPILSNKHRLVLTGMVLESQSD